MSYLIAWAIALLTALLAGTLAFSLPHSVGIGLAVVAVLGVFALSWRNDGQGPCLLYAVLLLITVWSRQGDEQVHLVQCSLALGLALAGVGTMALGGAGPSRAFALLSAGLGVTLAISRGPGELVPFLTLTLYQSLSVLLTLALRLLAPRLWLLAPLCLGGYLFLLAVMG